MKCGGKDKVEQEVVIIWCVTLQVKVLNEG
jgi:hypothetical protein